MDCEPDVGGNNIQSADGSEERYDMVDDPQYATAKLKLRKQLPKINQKPVPESVNRILIYENGVANWEGVDVGSNDPISD